MFAQFLSGPLAEFLDVRDIVQPIAGVLNTIVATIQDGVAALKQAASNASVAADDAKSAINLNKVAFVDVVVARAKSNAKDAVEHFMRRVVAKAILGF